jgi:hypothetical protein
LSAGCKAHLHHCIDRGLSKPWVIGLLNLNTYHFAILADQCRYGDLAFNIRALRILWILNDPLNILYRSRFFLEIEPIPFARLVNDDLRGDTFSAGSCVPSVACTEATVGSLPGIPTRVCVANSIGSMSFGTGTGMSLGDGALNDTAIAGGNGSSLRIDGGGTVMITPFVRQIG